MTRRLLPIPVVGLIAILFGLAWNTSVAAENLNVLVLGEDAGEDAIDRRSDAFQAIVAALATRLQEQGHTVVDEAEGLGGYIKGTVQRSDARVLDLAGYITDPPADAAVVFSVQGEVKHIFFQTRLIGRMAGRVLDVASGERLGAFQIELPEHKADRNWYVTALCPEECILKTIGNNADKIADEIAAAVSASLGAAKETASQ